MHQRSLGESLPCQEGVPYSSANRVSSASEVGHFLIPAIALPEAILIDRLDQLGAEGLVASLGRSFETCDRFDASSDARFDEE
jgi:hypothetical protein